MPKSNSKLEQKLLTAELTNETSSTNESQALSANQQQPNAEEQSKTDDLIKLQQKITKEILSSSLQENEMNALQVTLINYLISKTYLSISLKLGLCKTKVPRISLISLY